MRHTKYYVSVGVLGVALAAGSGILAESKPQGSAVEIRRTQEQVVLYTIHRGPFDKLGSTIGKLMGMAGPKGLYPKGSISLMYLNDFEAVPSQHWLTEIRIPVPEEGLRHAGTFGEFTDVKKLPSIEVAVASKPQGLASPESIYRQLHSYMFENGYMPTEGPCEVFLTNAQASDYSNMKSEIMIPSRKVVAAK